MTTLVLMKLTDHEIREWARCGQAMYDRGRNDLGHIMTARAAVHMMSVALYDEAAAIYRAWLVFDEPKLEAR